MNIGILYLAVDTNRPLFPNRKRSFSGTFKTRSCNFGSTRNNKVRNFCSQLKPANVLLQAVSMAPLASLGCDAFTADKATKCSPCVATRQSLCFSVLLTVFNVFVVGHMFRDNDLNLSLKTEAVDIV